MKKDDPPTLLEFEARFASGEACREYLQQLRWPEYFVCSRCGGGRDWPTTRGRLICRWCRYQTSVTAGAISQDTPKALRLWFPAIWHVTSQKNGAGATGLQRVLGLGKLSEGVDVASPASAGHGSNPDAIGSVSPWRWMRPTWEMSKRVFMEVKAGKGVGQPAFIPERVGRGSNGNRHARCRRAAGHSERPRIGLHRPGIHEDFVIDRYDAHEDPPTHPGGQRGDRTVSSDHRRADRTPRSRATSRSFALPT